MTLHRYAMLTAVATFFLLVAGAMVTSTDSGLAVPDWPLSYGTWFPPMVGGIFYEHGHRLVAAVVALMILGLALWLWRAEPRQWVRRLGYAALIGVMVQALLGGLTVLLLLPPPVSIAHALLGQTVFCLVTLLAYSTRPSWSEAPISLTDPGWLSLRLLSIGVMALAALQLLLGAIIRHTGLAVHAHMSLAGALAVGVSWLTLRVARLASTTIRHHAWRAAGLVGLQLILGMMVFFHRGAAALRTAHLATGALLLAQLLLLTVKIGDSHRITRGQTPFIEPPFLRGLTPLWKNQWLSPIKSYLELTKPRLSLLVLVTTGIGFWLGMREPAQGLLGLSAMVGTWLVVGGANALNQWMERDLDTRMQRTHRRPLPSGRLRPEHAYRFGWALMMWGVVWLALFVNGLSAVLAVIAAASYLLAYTPLKRRTALCTLVGAIPGAIPPMIGWVAARNALGIEAWVLFALLFVWQLPHFLAIAVLFHDDYARAGLRMLPVVEAQGYATARQTALYGLALIPVSLFPSVVGLGGMEYFVGALVLSLIFFALAVRTAWRRSPQSARQLFLASVVYLPILLALLGWNKVSAHPPISSARSEAFHRVRPLKDAGFNEWGLTLWNASEQVPDFSLVDHEGNAFTQDTLKGKIWIVDFVFTRCAGQCPLLTNRMRALQEMFREQSAVHFVSMSVDPTYDRPEVLKQHVGRAGLDTARWHWVTGSRQAIESLVREGFRLGIAEGGPASEPITHSVRLVLVDQQGAIRGYYDAQEASALAQLKQAIRELLAKGST